MALEALREAMRKLPGNVYRAKGVIYSTDAPGQRAVLQVVGRRVDISLQDEWGERSPRTQIVAIGEAGSIDAGMLEKTLASCIVEGDESRRAGEIGLAVIRSAKTASAGTVAVG